MNFRKSPFQVAALAAQKAGRLLMASYGKLRRSEIGQKSKNDFVTKVDRASERLILSFIKKHFPSDTIQAEESGVTTGKARLWLIDPLDGTSNYIHQFPVFSVSIGIMEGGVITAGVIFDPIHHELFATQKGKGAYLNGRRLRVTKTARLADAFMATGIPFRARDRFQQYLRSFDKISRGSVGLRRGGSAALDLAYVAAGRFDGFWEIDLSPWDIAAGALLIKEAGGKITDLWGTENYLHSGDTLASNGKIHGQLQSITSRAFRFSKKDKLWHFA